MGNLCDTGLGLAIFRTLALKHLRDNIQEVLSELLNANVRIKNGKLQVQNETSPNLWHTLKARGKKPGIALYLDQEGES